VATQPTTGGAYGDNGISVADVLTLRLDPDVGFRHHPHNRGSGRTMYPFGHDLRCRMRGLGPTAPRSVSTWTARLRPAGPVGECLRALPELQLRVVCHLCPLDQGDTGHHQAVVLALVRMYCNRVPVVACL